jgi:hypothetical protein
MPATDSDRILAPGVPVTLIDGRTVTLRYGMRAMKAIEDRWGSVGEAMLLLHGVLQGTTPKSIGTVVAFLADGLIHEGLSEDALLDLTEFGAMARYIDSIADALDEALPTPSPGKAEDGETPAASPGATTTTSSPSPSGGTTNGSG